MVSKLLRVTLVCEPLTVEPSYLHPEEANLTATSEEETVHIMKLWFPMSRTRTSILKQGRTDLGECGECTN